MGHLNLKLLGSINKTTDHRDWARMYVSHVHQRAKMKNLQSTQRGKHSDHEDSAIVSQTGL